MHVEFEASKEREIYMFVRLLERSARVAGDGSVKTMCIA